MKPVLILQNHPAECAGTILDYLRDRNLPTLVRRTYQHQHIPDVDEIDAVINLGCPHPASRYHELDYLADVFLFASEVVRKQKRYLGICFGGQLLAKVLGAEVSPNEVKEIGTYEIRLTEHGLTDPLFDGFDSRFQAFEWHNDTFKIPFGAHNLASSADCRNQAFRLGKAVGLQFHLDADSNEVGKWCDTYPDELVEMGKSKQQVVESFSRTESATKDLNYRLLDNFLSL